MVPPPASPSRLHFSCAHGNLPAPGEGPPPTGAPAADLARGGVNDFDDGDVAPDILSEP